MRLKPRPITCWPYIEVGFNATTDPSTYRMFGRGYYVKLTHSFE